MAENQAKLPLGATPGKLALMGVLAVVLFGVLIYQFGGMLFGSGSGGTPSPAARTNTNPVRPAIVETAAEPTVVDKPRPVWPRVSLSDALAHDPFAVSSALAVLLGPEPEAEQPASVALNEAEQLRAARLRETLGMLRSHGVSMIFDQGRGPVATVGDRMLQIGDVIGGFRVVDISLQEGVVLEAVDETETEPAIPPQESD